MGDGLRSLAAACSPANWWDPSAVFAARDDIVTALGFYRGRRRKGEAHRVFRAEASFELLAECGFGFDDEFALRGFFAREGGERGEFFLEIGRGDAIPESVFKFEHIHFLLLDREDGGVRQFHDDFFFAHIDREILPEIETGFDVKGAMELDPLRAPGPGVEEFVIDLRLAGEEGEFSDGAGLLEIDAIADRYARLQLRQFHEGVARFAPEPFEFGAGSFGVARGPGFEAPKNKTAEKRGEQEEQQKNERPGKSSSAAGGFVGHAGSNFDVCFLSRKKVPPPAPEGHEGRLFPPEQSSKSADEIRALAGGRNKFFGSSDDARRTLF